MLKRKIAAILTIDDSSESSSDDEEDLQLVAASALIYKKSHQRHRQQNYIQDIVALFRIDEFKTFFRLSRISIQILQEKICEICIQKNVSGIIDRHGTGGSVQIPLEYRLLILLWYMASKDKYAAIADRFGLSESTASCAIRNLLSFISQYLVDNVIKWHTLEELQEMQELYLQTKNFPGVCGMIDGSHIPIRRPSDRSIDYYNRKDFYSVVLQAVVAENLRFTNVFAGLPGKVHDARVLRHSPMYLNGSDFCGNGHVLGDSAYPNLPWLLTPFRDTGNLTPVQKKYNLTHSAIRSTVERAFGLLKGRFTRLQFIDQRHIQTIVQTIITGCSAQHMYN